METSFYGTDCWAAYLGWSESKFIQGRLGERYIEVQSGFLSSAEYDFPPGNDALAPDVDCRRVPCAARPRRALHRVRVGKHSDAQGQDADGGPGATAFGPATAANAQGKPLVSALRLTPAFPLAPHLKTSRKGELEQILFNLWV